MRYQATAFQLREARKPLRWQGGYNLNNPVSLLRVIRTVARRLGKPQSYLSKCESGERRVDVVELAEFARLYGKGLDFFVS